MRNWLNTLVLIWFPLVLVNATLQAQDEVDFSRDILPILSDNCFTCHGPDAATREGGFRLDVKESAFGEADSGSHPIVASDSSASEILARMRSDDESEVMPPPDQVKRPSAKQIELIERWIKQGADWKEHWAFISPKRPELPEVKNLSPTQQSSTQKSSKNQTWPRNGIDNFVLAKLERFGKQPSAEASKTTLVRRLYLDLIGLPPSPDQVDAFLNDSSEDAYERLVDQLLQSPHYGEHMATFWLDAARFADTNGYQNDFRRSMWLWRDWVINAYNDNMPYDQFTIEQLAGDMLPDATLEQKIASGFNRNHRSNTEGGSINEEWLVENVVDRVETTSTVFLGLTMGCARCHDHKFDPISQREFYQFFAYFHNVDERGVYTEKRGNAGPTVSVPTPEFKKRKSELETKLASQQVLQEQQREEILSLKKKKEEAITKSLTPDVSGEVLTLFNRSLPIKPETLSDTLGSLQEADRIKDSLVGNAVELTGNNDHIDLGSVFDFDATKNFSVSAWIKPTKFGAIVSRMDDAKDYRGFDMLIMPDGRLNVHLIHKWPNNGTKITSQLKIPKNRWSNILVTCSAPGKAKDIQIFFNGQPIPHTTDSDSLNGSTLTDHPVWVGLRAKTPAFAGQISDLRIWPVALELDAIQRIHKQTLEHMIVSTIGKRSEEQQTEINRHYTFSSTIESEIEIHKTQREIEELNKQLPTTMVMKELDNPRQTYVLNRGVYDQPDKEQPVSSAIPGLFKSAKTPTNRLELARWLVDGNNPLTARVAVNHFWNRYFGSGLLSTPDNFGVQSPPPSHPELLDWLACEFVDSGWDMKAMQRLIVTSATYRQSSDATTTAYNDDPDNTWLSRGPRFRLPAESLRDNALVISGLMTAKIGGPSVKPYQPEGLWAELAGGAGEPPYKQSAGEDLYRRSLYTYRKRTVPHPTVTTFDGVGRDICSVARDRTNTPLQALALLNDVTYVEAAIHLGIQAIESSKLHDERLKFAFRRATSRWPDAFELKTLSSAFEKYESHFEADPSAAKQFLETGEANPKTDLDPISLAAYASVCGVILNLDEVITRE